MGSSHSAPPASDIGSVSLSASGYLHRVQAPSSAGGEGGGGLLRSGGMPGDLAVLFGSVAQAVGEVGEVVGHMRQPGGEYNAPSLSSSESTSTGGESVVSPPACTPLREAPITHSPPEMPAAAPWSLFGLMGKGGAEGSPKHNPLVGPIAGGALRGRRSRERSVSPSPSNGEAFSPSRSGRLLSLNVATEDRSSCAVTQPRGEAEVKRSADFWRRKNMPQPTTQNTRAEMEFNTQWIFSRSAAQKRDGQRGKGGAKVNGTVLQRSRHDMDPRAPGFFVGCEVTLTHDACSVEDYQWEDDPLRPLYQDTAKR
eukprot:Hpha_TRINITY_DN15606_c1_g16::TRINITY_DN15606_c1_g16_i1::g.100773::m.100773